MKPTPLKDKKTCNDPNCTCPNFFFLDDVKSAVEWLKQEIQEAAFGGQNRVHWKDHWLNIKINKAFEDVMKKEAGK